MSNDQKYEEILGSNANKICLIAGPGSGKTKCIIIPKTKQILSDDSIDPKTVLLISFSRPSAQDLKKRVQELEKTPIATTLHSLCLSFLLSENNHDIRKRIESILLDFEKEVLASDIKQQIPLLHKRDIKKMLKEFSAGWAVKPHELVFVENEEKKRFKGVILNWLNEYEAAMMEEIVYSAVDLAKKVKSDFIDNPKYILIDEFQDLNQLEQEFVSLLSQNSTYTLIVGDPDQSIYSFKYAYPIGIIDVAGLNQVENHTLEYTGRCGKKIVEIANKVLLQIEPTRTQLLKPLPNAVDGAVKIKSLRTQEEEFDFIVSDISKKIENGLSPKEILVLVPKKKIGESFVKYANGILPDTASYSFLLNHKTDLSLKEKEVLLLFGLIANPKSLLHIRSFVGLYDDAHFSKEILEIKQFYGSLLDAFDKAQPEDFDQRKQKIRRLCAKLQELKDFLSTHKPESDLSTLIQELLPESNSDLSALKKLLLELKEEHDSIKSLYDKLIDYMRTLQTDENRVSVMTILASKGLDAEDVYIIGCNDGNIPGDNRSGHLSDYEFKREQQRLFYVGITRAKKSLTITWSRYIPFQQAVGQYTASVGTATINGKRYSKVGLSEIVQNLI